MDSFVCYFFFNWFSKLFVKLYPTDLTDLNGWLNGWFFFTIILFFIGHWNFDWWKNFQWLIFRTTTYKRRRTNIASKDKERTNFNSCSCFWSIIRMNVYMMVIIVTACFGVHTFSIFWWFFFLSICPFASNFIPNASIHSFNLYISRYIPLWFFFLFLDFLFEKN